MAIRNRIEQYLAERTAGLRRPELAEAFINLWNAEFHVDQVGIRPLQEHVALKSVTQNPKIRRKVAANNTAVLMEQSGMFNNPYGVVGVRMLLREGREYESWYDEELDLVANAIKRINIRKKIKTIITEEPIYVGTYSSQERQSLELSRAVIQGRADLETEMERYGIPFAPEPLADQVYIAEPHDVAEVLPSYNYTDAADKVIRFESASSNRARGNLWVPLGSIATA